VNMAHKQRSYRVHTVVPKGEAESVYDLLATDEEDARTQIEAVLQARQALLVQEAAGEHEVPPIRKVGDVEEA